MDILLGQVTKQAMNYAIRSGVAITASYAIRQSAKLLDNVPKSTARDELVTLQRRLQDKVQIISPAIDMIELIAARGNTSLESAVTLTKDLRLEIQTLGQKIANANASVESNQRTKFSSHAALKNELELKSIVAEIKRILARIEDAVPLISLAITTSGASLSTKLPSTVSPSRLLQASTFLTQGDFEYANSPTKAVQTGPTFTLTVYMLFAGHDRPQNVEEIRQTTWKEVIHKARVKLRRVPVDVVVSTGSGSDAIPAAQIDSPDTHGLTHDTSRISAPAMHEYAYQLMIIEDFDDDRVHDFANDTKPGAFDDVRLAGIREMIPIHEISKIFYADTSKVLNIGTEGETNHPVLLLKRDLNAIPPRRMMIRENSNEQNEPWAEGQMSRKINEEADMEQNRAESGEDPWRFPRSLDPEWIAFEVYTEAEENDSDGDFEEASESPESSRAVDMQLPSSLSQLKLDGQTSIRQDSPAPPTPFTSTQQAPWAHGIRTSLSLLELLLRLTSLQQFQQQPHLSITDELLNFFLEESATTGAGGDENHRQALRADARRRVGWDPYDESPVKHRGEDYQYYADTPSPGRVNGAAQSNRAWIPLAAHTKSITGVPDSPLPASPSPSPSLPAKSRSSLLLKTKSQEERKSSPLRTQALSDEGIGTSPGSL